MMNQGSATVTTLDPSSQENHQAVDPNQHHMSSYYAPPNSTVAPWSAHAADSYARENGVVSHSGYDHDQQAAPPSRNVQDGLNVAASATTPSSGATNVQQDYSSYGTYQSTDPYGYNNTGYAAYYNGYQQQPNQSYPQPSGAYQNTGAPYQPLSSLQNTGSYAGPASYSSTYYNPGDYQTSGGYTSGAYNNQTNAWHEGQYATYTSHQYPSYNSDSNAAYSSTTAPAASQYQQQYKQWADYYNHTQNDVPCAPGTENISVSNVSSLSCPVPAGYPASGVQAPASHAPPGKPESGLPALSAVQPDTFPKSLCGYVERALARCKDDTQMVASQAVMKEIITKATADGTLHTRDWDTEPLFPMSSVDADKKERVIFSAPVSSSPKSKRSPSRRYKSRWEPLEVEKPTVQPASVTPDASKYGSWNKQRKTPKTDVFRPAKRQCVGDEMDVTDNGEASSDSDKERSQSAYKSAAGAAADTPEERKRRENRSKRFERGHGSRIAANDNRSRNGGAGNVYARRATALVLSRNIEENGNCAVEDIDWDALTVKGTCQEIEKRYLRLTSAPDPATVRPEEVLEKALKMVQSSPKNYLYKCDQLKSIRQDLTVQRIRNELTVKVYETHGRLAIEVGDLSEFNQCQSQLKTLYAEGIKGCDMEFVAYNLLCVLLHSSNNRDLLLALSRLPAEARQNDAVKHALSVRAAVSTGNYVAYFRLYKTAPNLNTCLMDLYADKMRYAAVRCMSRSNRPTVPVTYIAQVLGFTSEESEDTDGVEDCVEWLKAHGACLTSDNPGEMQFDAKASVSTLYMPEPEDAVSHGDASLAVNDFLTRNLA
ncbi:SAC3 family protein A isoform X14 [Solanum lycopersicum]|uniref:SAC3 family protein A isoform X14 n=1 Tax=Solanum lycopersicum TaxID=4081 RepID=UPI003749A409